MLSSYPAGVQESRPSVLKQENNTQGYRWEITDKRNENKILGGREGERERFLFSTILSGNSRYCLKVAKQGVIGVSSPAVGNPPKH